MSEATKDFFKAKKEWSKVKDELLECYLEPYMQKIFATRKPVNYIDCFAGKGKFEDGSDGSPLIALKMIEKCKHNSHIFNNNVKSYFIEKKFDQELSENLKDYSNIEIRTGEYKDSIIDIIKNKRGENLFLYIDPFGIKSLGSFKLFSDFLKVDSYSVEILLNFNSFGFIRNAAKVLKASNDIINSLDNVIVEYMGDYFFFDFSNELSKSELNEIAGGNYWQPIILDYINNKIDCHEAEKQFSTEFCKKLSTVYKYVLNLPIKLGTEYHPKYRMIHLTNNEDGCLLMYKNMCKRFSDKLVFIQSKGMPSLFSFEENFENDIVDNEIVKTKLLAFIKTKNDFENLSILLSEFLTQYGILGQYNLLIKIFKELEKNGEIIVKRSPEFTEKKHEKSIFWEEKQNQTIRIKGAK